MSMNVKIISDGEVVFTGLATWPRKASRKRRRSSVEEEDTSLTIRIPKKLAKPPPPARPPPPRAPAPTRGSDSPDEYEPERRGGRPPPTARRGPDKEDSEGNLEGFVVGSSDEGSHSGSEQQYYSSDEDEEYGAGSNPTTMRQHGSKEGLVSLSNAVRTSGTPEENAAKRKEMALRRKRQAEKAAEKTKKETIERILNQKGAKGKREEKEAKAKKDGNVEKKAEMMSCAHFRMVSNKEHPALLCFSKAAPMPPMFKAKAVKA